MPSCRNKFLRLSKIYTLLEIWHDKDLFISGQKLCDEVNDRIDFTVCKSSIEKDIFTLKEDFDLEIKSSPKGIILVKKIDFRQAMLQYLGLD